MGKNEIKTAESSWPKVVDDKPPVCEVCAKAYRTLCHCCNAVIPFTSPLVQAVPAFWSLGQLNISDSLLFCDLPGERKLDSPMNGDAINDAWEIWR